MGDLREIVQHSVDGVVVKATSGGVASVVLAQVNEALAAFVALLTIIYLASKIWAFWADRRAGKPPSE